MEESRGERVVHPSRHNFYKPLLSTPLPNDYAPTIVTFKEAKKITQGWTEAELISVLEKIYNKSIYQKLLTKSEGHTGPMEKGKYIFKSLPWLLREIYTHTERGEHRPKLELPPYTVAWWADFRDVDCNCELIHVDLRSADISGAKFFGLMFQDANFGGVRYNNATVFPSFCKTQDPFTMAIETLERDRSNILEPIQNVQKRHA